MKINSLSCTNVNTPFKARFTFAINPDYTDDCFDDMESKDIFVKAAVDDPKGFKKLMNFLDYMKSFEGMTKLSDLPASDELDLEVTVENDYNCKKPKLRFTPFISYTLVGSGDPNSYKISDYFFDRGFELGKKALKDPSDLFEHIDDVLSKKIDIDA